MTTLSFISSSEQQTRKFAAEFAKTLKGDEKVCLTGPFGSGKTTFVRGFVEAFGIAPNDVYSPTFTLVREYGDDKKIYHVDLYRLDKEDDIFEAGIFDLITGDGLTLIEWADRLQKYAPEHCVRIQFLHSGDNERTIEVEF